MTPTETKKRNMSKLEDMQEAREAIQTDMGAERAEHVMHTYALAGMDWKAVSAFHMGRWSERNRLREEMDRIEIEARKRARRARLENKALRELFKLGERDDFRVKPTWSTGARPVPCDQPWYRS